MLGKVSAGLIAFFVTTAAFGCSAFAAHNGYKNDYEKWAQTGSHNVDMADLGSNPKCPTSKTIGIIWLTDGTSAARHYNDNATISIDWNQTGSISVYINGSILSCSGSDSPGGTAHAVNDVGGLNLTNYSSHSLNRGSSTSYQYSDTPSGSYISAKLTIPSGIAAGSSKKYTVKIGRCFSNPNGGGTGTTEAWYNGRSAPDKGGCGVAYAPLIIKRGAAPPWLITPTVQIKNGSGAWSNSDITAYGGDTIYWQHRFGSTGAGNPPAVSYGWDSEPKKWSQNVGVGGTGTWHTSTAYKIPLDAAAGSTHCRRTGASPSSGAGNSVTASGTTWSSWRCAKVAIRPWTTSPQTKMTIDRSSTSGTNYNGAYSSTNETTQNVAPGHTIKWDHQIKQNGAGASNTIVNFYSSGANGNGATQSFAAGWAAGSTVAYTGNSASLEKLNRTGGLIGKDDVGKTYCRNAVASTGGHNGTTQLGAVNSGNHCIYTPYNYTTSTSITATHSGLIEAGSVIGAKNGTVKTDKYNSGTTLGTYETKTKPGEWRVAFYNVAQVMTTTPSQTL
ncbi:MAG: hypothetical protein LBG75_00010 [Candidatus Nomurabacteria bacterium]|jgi:hypothetical protein|nr:hypothetical protein [Candidatus Nomurabacteria bacterium]